MYGNPEIWNYGITENWIFGLFSIPEDARTRFLIKEICTEIRNYGVTEIRVCVPFSIPEDARTRFLNLREVLTTPETERSLTPVYCQMLHFSHEPLI